MLVLLIGAVAVAMIVMTIVWLISVRIHNAGIVDIAWSANFGFIALLYALSGPGYYARRILAAGMTAATPTRVRISLNGSASLSSSSRCAARRLLTRSFADSRMIPRTRDT